MSSSDPECCPLVVTPRSYTTDLGSVQLLLGNLLLRRLPGKKNDLCSVSMVPIKAFDPGAVGKLLRDFLFMQEARTLPQAEPVKAHFKCRLLDMYSESSLGFQAVNAVSCKDGQVSAPPPPARRAHG